MVVIVLPNAISRRIQLAHRAFVFWRAMRIFLKDPTTHGRPGSRVLADLVYGWGNEGWSAREEFLARCVDQALRSEGPILECGSGLSTVLLGAIAARRGRPYLSLEHEPGWANRVRQCLTRYHVDPRIVLVAPLKDYGEYDWYDVKPEFFTTGVTLVICDGPPGSTRGGRYGLVPNVRALAAPGCVILLDDGGREQELAIAGRWAAELGTTFRIEGTAKPYIELQFSGRAHTAGVAE